MLDSKRPAIPRRDGRVAEGARLESVYTARYPGFESLSLRHRPCFTTSEDILNNLLKFQQLLGFSVSCRPVAYYGSRSAMGVFVGVSPFRAGVISKSSFRRDFMALTDTEIKRAKPRLKPYSMRDSGGLHLEITPAGGKLWRWKYRFEGKEKLMALAKYPQTRRRWPANVTATVANFWRPALIRWHAGRQKRSRNRLQRKIPLRLWPPDGLNTGKMTRARAT